MVFVISGRNGELRVVPNPPSTLTMKNKDIQKKLKEIRDRLHRVEAQLKKLIAQVKKR